jgi:carbonic anhydrase
MDPDEALGRLIEGNGRFRSGKPQHNLVSQERLLSLASRQQPFAAILGCADSRVPPELVFDQGFGDLFVLRLAGNVISPGVLGSLQFAYLNLNISLLVVLGHEDCGAVRAAVACKFHRQEHPEHIQNLVALIEPALVAIHPDQSADEQVRAAVEANVHWSIQQVRRTPELQGAERDRPPIRLVGAVYQLATGNVRWLDP